MALLIRKTISYGIDFCITMAFTQLYIFCSNVFLLDQKTQSQAIIMLLCALATVFLLTCYIPTKSNGQTLGEMIMKVRVINNNKKDRTYFQSFLRECVVKFTFAPVFLILSVGYIILNSISNKGLCYELPHDFILKTEVVLIKETKKVKKTILNN